MNFEFLASIGILPRIAGVLFILLGIFLILVVLIQKGRGGGISAAFGGGGGGQSVFGSKTGDMLTWVTIGITVLFFLLAMYLSPNFKPTYEEDAIVPQSQVQPGQPIQEQPAGDTPGVPVTPEDAAPAAPSAPDTAAPAAPVTTDTAAPVAPVAAPAAPAADPQ